MATTFFKDKFGGQEVVLTSFYGGKERGRCLQIRVGEKLGEFTEDTVREAEFILTKTLKVTTLGNRVTFILNNLTIKMGKGQGIRFAKALAQWLLRDITPLP